MPSANSTQRIEYRPLDEWVVTLKSKEDYFNKGELIDFSKWANEITRYHNRTIIVEW